MHRRSFLQLAASATALGGALGNEPVYKSVSNYPASASPGMPGRYPAAAIRVHSDAALNVQSNRADPSVVRAMLSAGMRELTSASADEEAWSRFVSPGDIVGIKVNCSGAPEINSSPELVNAIIGSLLGVGVPPDHIYIYDRFWNQMRIVNFEAHVPKGVQTAAAETSRGSILGYDPYTYVDVDFFGEEDTRSNLIRLVSEKFTKVINVPTMKEHRAAGVTGCLKNIAYGDFSNVARSHRAETRS